MCKTIDEAGVRFEKLSSGVYQFTWHTPSIEAMDVWFRINDALYEKTSPSETLHLLHVVDMPFFPSINQIVRRARKLQQKYPEQPQTRSAILFSTGYFGAFINALSQLLNKDGKDVTRVFRPNEYEQAVTWLLD